MLQLLQDNLDAQRQAAIARDAEVLYRKQHDSVLERTDRFFAGLLGLEWVLGILAALFIAPRTWAGTSSQVHVHVWAALLLGGGIVALPIALARLRPGRTETRHVIAAGQMLVSALWIHLTGGRIETHFHVFGSLAILAYYRDWRVLVTASTVVAIDHLLRGIYWPQSVYGVLAGAQWRWLEHAGWVAFQDAFLIRFCLEGIRDMREAAEREATLRSLIRSHEENTQTQQAIRKLLDQVSGVAKGDLRGEVEVTADITGAIADAFNVMLYALRRIIGSVHDTTLRVNSAAHEIRTTTEQLAKGNDFQAEEILHNSEAIDAMAASIQKVSETVVVSATVAHQSLDSALKGGLSVKKTIEGMQGIRERIVETSKRIQQLGERSQEVGEIATLIEDIAERTSILALNASIQAAVAGDAGKGFAVVASEVERLATRSTEATKRINTLVQAIQAETLEVVSSMEQTSREAVSGSKLANEAGQALHEIQAVSERLAELIQSISVAAKQQARTSDSLARSMGDLSGVTKQTAAGTKQAVVSVSHLTDLTAALRDSVSTFKLPASEVRPALTGFLR
jgi:methyl-accepting chemotaxis protein